MAEVEQRPRGVGGAEAEPPTAGEAEAGQSIAHADRMHPEPPRGRREPGAQQGWTETPTATQHTLTASTGAQERHTLPEVVRGYPGHPHATHSPSDAPPATTDGAGAQLPTHRAKRATAAQDDPQRVRHTPI